MQKLARPQEYDAIVVGSGASGGWAAKRMSEAGMRVALESAARAAARAACLAWFWR